MLKTIAIVTLLVNQLGAVETPYREHLGYEPVHRGTLPPAQTTLWATPALAGKPFVILQPASKQPVYLRLIEDPAVKPPPAGTTRGWNAVEYLAKDPDGLATKLAGTPFEVVGPARDLWAAPDAPRAMQAAGPVDELLYFTRVIQSGFSIPMTPTQTPVDRVFITVVGGPSMDELRDFYGRRLGLRLSPVMSWRIGVLADALDLPAETMFPLATAAMPRNFLVEMDEYPASVPPRAVGAGSLPPGVAMVSFGVTDLDALKLTWRAAPARLAEFPYSGQEAAVTVGPAGEFVELVEVAGATKLR